MRIFTRLLGLILIILGIYFIGQNIFFTTQASPYWWRDISAAGSVLSIVTGLVLTIFFSRELGNIGWIFVILGILLVFVSGRVILRPTSLWYFFLSFASLIGGFSLLRTGQIRF